VIAFVDGEEVEAILGKEGDFWKIIEINGEHEHAVLEGVLFWGDAGVGYVAFIQGVLHRRGAEAAEGRGVLEIWCVLGWVQGLID
jgi:hypothetical protein